MLDVLMRAQNTIHASLSADLNAFATNQDWLALLAVLPAGALFGSIHALTPGHGKSVLASYLVGSGLRTARAAGVAMLLAAMHIGSAVVLALIAAPLVTRTFVGGGRAPSLEIASRLLLIGIGVWLVERSLWRRPHAYGEGVAVSLAAGLVPCPLTLFVMFFALSRGVLEAGLAFAAAMLVGVGSTLVGVALAAILARDQFIALLARHGASLDRVARSVDAIAGVALVIVAGLELLRVRQNSAT